MFLGQVRIDQEKRGIGTSAPATLLRRDGPLHGDTAKKQQGEKGPRRKETDDERGENEIRDRCLAAHDRIGSNSSRPFPGQSAHGLRPGGHSIPSVRREADTDGQNGSCEIPQSDFQVSLPSL